MKFLEHPEEKNLKPIDKEEFVKSLLENSWVCDMRDSEYYDCEYDNAGIEVPVPKCEKCGTYKSMVISACNNVWMNQCDCDI